MWVWVQSKDVWGAWRERSGFRDPCDLRWTRFWVYPNPHGVWLWGSPWEQVWVFLRSSQGWVLGFLIAPQEQILGSSRAPLGTGLGISIGMGLGVLQSPIGTGFGIPHRNQSWVLAEPHRDGF